MSQITLGANSHNFDIIEVGIGLISDKVCTRIRPAKIDTGL